ncbi:MAG: hypothetical protein AB1513_01675 [Pseudomonadota bacterium]
MSRSARQPAPPRPPVKSRHDKAPNPLLQAQQRWTRTVRYVWDKKGSGK